MNTDDKILEIIRQTGGSEGIVAFYDALTKLRAEYAAQGLEHKWAAEFALIDGSLEALKPFVDG